MQNSVGNSQISQQMPVYVPLQSTNCCQQNVNAQNIPYCTSPYDAQNAAQNYQVPNYSGVNIQIFNPSVTPPGAQAPVYNVNAPSYQAQGHGMPYCYPPNYYTGQFPAQNDNSSNVKETSIVKETVKEENVKTEKRKVVQLTDEYIKNLENYLNSQDKDVRYMGAKEVVARLEEDDSRASDKALNALINKMMKDPYDKVRFLAMATLRARIAEGNDESVALLKQMQTSSSAYGMDAPLATDTLLQMSAKKVEKEFVVKENKKTDKK